MQRNYEAPRSDDRGIFSPLLRRERNPSEAEISSHSSTGLRPRFSAKGDKQAGSQTNSVTLTASGFTPQSITVKAGTTVIWTNNSGATATVSSDNHPTHLVYPPLNLGSFGNSETLLLVFDQPGTYKYHNHLNASQTGVVVVN